MKHLKAILVNNIHYCVFPKGINGIEEFVAFLNQRYQSFFALEIVIEKGCAAPFFIEENWTTELQYWNPSAIRTLQECEIFVLKQCEYEERLKQVIQETCIHCTHYSEDFCEEDFKSHAEQINLHGECYGFEKNRNEGGK